MSCAMARQSKLQKGARNRALATGVLKHWMSSGPIWLARRRYEHAEVIARLQSLTQAHDTTSAEYAAWRAQVAKERALEKELAAFVRAVTNRALAVHDMKALADFGIRYSKPGPKKLQSKAAMVEKARTTRIDRHTMGKRQKQKLRKA